MLKLKETIQRAGSVRSTPNRRRGKVNSSNPFDSVNRKLTHDDDPSESDLSDGILPSGIRESISIPVTPDITNVAAEFQRSRSASAQRPTRRQPDESLTILGTADADSRRSMSVGRSRVSQNVLLTQESEESSDKHRISKSEKIRKLQAKNELYKTEYKRVQKDRKTLRKEIESKRLELAALTKECDAHIAETSALKDRLANVLHHNTHSGNNQRESITKLSKDLESKQGEVTKAWQRVAEIRDSVSELNEQVQRKDEQIETLSVQLTEITQQHQSLQQELQDLKDRFAKEADEKSRTLQRDNGSLRVELDITMERAAKMVKEREEAIEELLKENETLKRDLALRGEPDKTQISEEDIMNLKDELDDTRIALEDSQARSTRLEEEIESWISRGNEMEDEIDRLRQDVASWQGKTEKKTQAADRVRRDMESMEQALKAAQDARESLESKHKAKLSELEIKHRAAILDAREKAAEEASMVSEARTAESQQAMLLKAAVANRKNKAGVAGNSHGGSSWLLGFRKSGGEDSDLSEEQRRIKEFELMNEDQAGEIERLKSELVRLRSSQAESLYLSKKRIEELQRENEASAVRIDVLEKELARSQRR